MITSRFLDAAIGKIDPNMSTKAQAQYADALVTMMSKGFDTAEALGMLSRLYRCTRVRCDGSDEP